MDNAQLQEKVSKFIYDYYLRWGDADVITRDDMSFDFCHYAIDDDTAEVDKSRVFCCGNITVNDDGTVDMTLENNDIGFISATVFDSWNSFIEYKRLTADITENVYMNWRWYKL